MTAGLVVPPNTIDFDTVFDDMGAKTAENPGVLIVVSILAGLYLLLLINLSGYSFLDRERTRTDACVYGDCDGLYHPYTLYHTYTRAHARTHSHTSYYLQL